MRAQLSSWVLFVAIGAGLLAGTVGSGQGATAQESAIPDVALCQAEPRTFDEIMAVFADAPPFVEPAVSEYVEVPTGRTASATLTEGVTATVYEAFACLNGGDMLRF